MRLFLTVVLTFFTLGLPAQASQPAAPVPATAGFVGNKDPKIYHTPACKLVLKIKPENKVLFATKAEAVAAGYAPCKLCIK